MDALPLDAWSQLQLAPRLGAALLVGALVGLEREHADRPAGLRTHMLVCGAAALLVVLAEIMVLRYVDVGNARPDPIRVMEAIVAGISFIGAGTIFVSGQRHRIRGLTTAASLFAVAAVGIACGLGLYVLAAMVAVAVVVILRSVAWLERHLMKKGQRLAEGEEQYERDHRPEG